MVPAMQGKASPKNRLGMIVALGALTAFAPLSIDMYLPAFPALEGYFATDAGAVQATLAAFFIGLAIGQAFHGPLSDRFGRRAPLMAGIGIYIAASIGAIFAPDIETLAVLRFIQAIGGCAGMVIARAMVRDLFDERDSAKVFSMLMLVMGLAPILAPLLGGQILILADWRVIFLVLAGFGALCLFGVVVFLPETHGPDRRQRGGLGPVLRAYGRLLADPIFMGFGVANALLSAGLFSYITGSPFVFITLYGVSPQEYGLLFSLNAIGLIAATQVNVRLLRYWSGRQILKVAMAINAVAGLALAGMALAQPASLFLLMVPLFTTLVSLGFVGANAMAAAMSRAGHHAGAASALLGVMQFGFGAVAGAAVSLFENGTAGPMGLVMAGLAVAGFTVHRLLADRS
jgi:DHA1 family bicyclomycin/chloramphenicol resistance-like MFS transporter